MSSPAGELKCLALILSLPSTSSNSVLVLSAQSSISDCSLCPNAFGGGSPIGLLPKGGTTGPPAPYSTIIYCAHLSQLGKPTDSPIFVRMPLCSIIRVWYSFFIFPSFLRCRQTDSQKFWIHLRPLPLPVASHRHAAHALHSYVECVPQAQEAEPQTSREAPGPL